MQSHQKGRIVFGVLTQRLTAMDGLISIHKTKLLSQHLPRPNVCIVCDLFKHEKAMRKQGKD